MLSAALASAIDATATADSYADAHGRRVTFSSEDIRAFGLSIYISPPSATSCAPSCAQKTKPSARKPAPKSCPPTPSAHSPRRPPYGSKGAYDRAPHPQPQPGQHVPGLPLPLVLFQRAAPARASHARAGHRPRRAPDRSRLAHPQARRSASHSRRRRRHLRAGLRRAVVTRRITCRATKRKTRTNSPTAPPAKTRSAHSPNSGGPPPRRRSIRPRSRSPSPDQSPASTSAPSSTWSTNPEP